MMRREEVLEQILTRYEAEKLLDLQKQAFQYHLDKGNIRPCKVVGERTGTVQLFWKDDVLSLHKRLKARKKE